MFGAVLGAQMTAFLARPLGRSLTYLAPIAIRMRRCFLQVHTMFPEDRINACKFVVPVVFFFLNVMLARLLRVTIFVPWLDDYKLSPSHYFLAEHKSDVRLAVRFMIHHKYSMFPFFFGGFYHLCLFFTDLYDDNVSHVLIIGVASRP